MTKNRNSHGEYILDTSMLSENILIAQLTGSWNLETAREEIAEMLVISEKLKQFKWGILIDMREWEICTPEVMEYFNSSVEKFTERNFRVQAVLLKMSMQKMVIAGYESKANESDNILTTQYFNDYDLAFDWLLEQVKTLNQ